MENKSHAPRSSKVSTSRKRFTTLVSSDVKQKAPSTVKVPKGKSSKSSHRSTTSLSNHKMVFVKSEDVSYEAILENGSGNFGVVYKAKRVPTGEIVAVKRVLEDTRYKNRELQIMKTVDHFNVVKLLDNFYEKKDDGVYLNLVLEFIPKDLGAITWISSKLKQPLPVMQIKFYSYQLLRSVAYIHSLGVCHRDIKPQNLLVNPESHILKLCDMGSAKILVAGEPNISYICSRYYRAPELCFGAEEYTTKIDVWSVGCVIGELFLGYPLFVGKDGLGQLVEIIKVLGTPSKEEIFEMNPTAKKQMSIPQVPKIPWSKIFSSKAPKDALDLIDKLLTYVPKKRLDPLEALTHPFFDDIRDPKTLLPNGKPIPELAFEWTDAEKEYAMKQGFWGKLQVKKS